MTPKPTTHRGPPIQSDGPVSSIAKLLGMSMPEIAAECGVPYPSVKTWNRRKRLPEHFEKALVALLERRQGSQASASGQQ